MATGNRGGLILVQGGGDEVVIRLCSCPDPAALRDYSLAELAERSRRLPESRAFLIVPEAAKADSERRYLEHFDARGLLVAEVLSFRRLAHRLFSELGGLSGQALSNAGKALLVQQVLQSRRSDFRSFARLSGRPGFQSGLVKVLGDLRRYQIDGALLRQVSESLGQGISSDKLADLATLEAYVQEEIRERGLDDSDDDLKRLAELLRQSQEAAGFLGEAAVWIYGFGMTRDFTPQEYELIRLLAEQVAELTLCLCSGTESESRELGLEAGQLAFDHCRLLFPEAEIRILEDQRPKRPELIVNIAAENGREELAYVAGEIRRLVQEDGVRRRDIAVAYCNAQDEEKLRRILSDYGLDPFFNEVAPLGRSPLLRYLTAFLQLSAGSGELEDLNALVRSSLVDLGETGPEAYDHFENYCLEFGLEKLYQFSDERYYKGSRGAAALDLKQTVLDPHLKAAKELSAYKTAAERCRFLAHWLDQASGIRERLEAESLALRQSGHSEQALLDALAWEALLSRLEDGVALLKETELSPEAFASLLLDDLKSMRPSAIPVGIDRVRVGTPEQILLYPCTVLFIVGADQGTFPPRLSDEGLLLDIERELIEHEGQCYLPNSKRDAIRSGRFIRNCLLRLPTEKLYLSSPTTDSALWSQTALEFQLRSQTEAGIVSRRLGEPQKPDVRWLNPQKALMELRLQAEHGRSEAAETPALPTERALEAAALPETLSLWRKALKDCVELETSILAPDILDEIQPQLILPAELMNLYFAETSKRRLSASLLEQYRSCPYRYFAGYMLRLCERRVYRPDMREQGTCLHALLEAALKPLTEIPADRSVEQVRESYEVWKSELKPETLWQIYKELGRTEALAVYSQPEFAAALGLRLCRSAHKALQKTSELIGPGGFMPYQLEWNFPAEGRQGLSFFAAEREFDLVGQIDRVDLMSGGLYRIVDYKSHGREMNHERLFYGLDLQLPLYREAWQQNEAEMVAEELQFFRVSAAGNISNEYRPKEALSADKERCHSLGGRDLIRLVGAQAIRVVNRSLAELTAGEISPKPRAVQGDTLPCEFCGYGTLCRSQGREEVRAELFPRFQYESKRSSATEKEEFLKKALEAEEQVLIQEFTEGDGSLEAENAVDD